MKKIMFFILIIFIFVSCNDDIFYRISLEIKNLEPRIKGSPSNFVIFDDSMYVASSRRLYHYNKNDGWNVESLSDDFSNMRIIQLAAAGDYLYAFCYEDKDKSVTRKILRRKASEDWTEAPQISDGILQSIYSANNKLFIGVQKTGTNEHAVYVIENDALNEIIQGKENALLVGAASNGTTVFLCTMTGIYTDNGNIVRGSGVSGIWNVYSGIIALNESIVAINREGNLYKVYPTSPCSCENDDPEVPDCECDGNNEDCECTDCDSRNMELVARLNIDRNRRWLATGALAVWEKEEQFLLLAGRQEAAYTLDTGFRNGYMELHLSNAGGIGGNTFKEPGKDSPTSIHNDRNYESMFGRYPINHIIQVPEDIDPDRTLFASTQREGVWSYRVRDGNPIWNAEE